MRPETCSICRFWNQPWQYVDTDGELRSECSHPRVRAQFDGDYPASSYANFGCVHHEPLSNNPAAESVAESKESQEYRYAGA